MADIKYDEMSDEMLTTLQQGSAAEIERRAPKVYMSDIKPNMTAEEHARVRAAIDKALKGWN